MASSNPVGRMARRWWTLLVVSDDPTEVRQFRISREFVRVTVAGVLVLFSVLTSLAAGFFVKEGQRLQVQRLERENALLEAEMDEIQAQLATLQHVLSDLSSRDEHYRLLAGLEPIDEEVRQAGIGGPGTATLQTSELWQHNPRLGEMAFAASYDLHAMVRRARLLARSWSEATDSLSSKHERLAATPSILPTAGYVSSSFSRSRWHPILERPRAHTGIDISAPKGTPIVAAAKGRVKFVGWQGEYGLMIEIDHGYGYVTRYAHASRVNVRVGQEVTRGEKIGEVGSTGLAVGPHVHYEVLERGRPVNPRNFILDGEANPR